MKKTIDIQRVKFYLWVALAYTLLWLIHNTTKYPGNFFPILWNNLWRGLYIVALNYIFFEYAVSFVLRKREYIIYNILWGIGVLFVFLMLWSYGLYGWRAIGLGLNIYTSLVTTESVEYLVQSQMSYSAGAVFFFGIARHAYQYSRLKAAAQQLRIEKQEAELNYLRSQTNPHFLFNTLNNIYSLARDKSDLAAESIMRLSKILRFMLYETGGTYIAIEQELKIISDYIALEKLRYDDSLHVNLNHNVEDMKQAIPPLLLIPLVENAFKHGVSETRHRPFVDIHLSVNKQQLKFVVKNSVEGISGSDPVKENIGLTNLRRQLELLYTDYSLSVEEAGTIFIATLTINLASHV